MNRTSVLPSSVLRRGLLAGAAATATLVLSACGGSGSTSGDHGSMMTAPSSAAAGTATVNDADIAFTEHMIGHHQQAIQMAAMADSRAARTDVKDLAAKIKAAQQPEIDTMNGWLTTWGKPGAMPGMTTGSSMPGMGSDQPSMGSMPGAMSDADMNALMSAKGTAFDKMFLTLMISHHQGAVEMAQQEAGQGANPDAVALARKIITDQQAEIAQMKGMLATL
ncbi:hypothetical protein Adu01nite_27490 [Paractinoplanes durhamensis]|uniref:DUF305 domain-containing protein n=2 Tax=Paractinoplanes durhamensis TaxID=113563 RepID=A0ABQ3YV08_9ACTN|nr:hypothetical protein Adu01nite_27490 [Actinoplanes durhamensis]